MQLLTKNLYIFTKPDRKRAIAYSINAMACTPDDTDSRTIVEDDRPYAGLLLTMAEWITPSHPQGSETVSATEVAGASGFSNVNQPGIDVDYGMTVALDNDALYRKLLLKFQDSQAEFIMKFKQSPCSLVQGVR